MGLRHAGKASSHPGVAGQHRFAEGSTATGTVDPQHLKEVIIHLAFYAGWPRAMSAIAVAEEAFNS
jgi:hypothetical protein